jgi:Domain of unknown function (DUF4342)
MSVDLAKVDQIRERMRCTYGEARDALQDASGDVVTALANLEKKSAGGDDILALSSELVEDVQRLLELGPIRRLRVRIGEHVLREVPVAATAVGAIVLGLLAVLASRLTIDLIRDPISEEEA